MASISAIILGSNQKKDGTWNVKIRIWHNKQPAYIETEHFVGPKQVLKKGKDNKSVTLKDQFVIDRINPTLRKYRDWISDNAEKLAHLTAQQIKARLLSIDKKIDNTEVDFLTFSKNFIEDKLNSTKASSAKSLRTVYNSITDYFQTTSLPITEVNYAFLKKYESFLKSERKLTRNNHSNKTRTYIQKGLSESGLHNHMRDLRLLFNEARNHFNDEDLGIIRIAHYPFKKYKVGQAPLTKHRDRPINEIIKIRDVEVPKNSRAELARDLSLLSFYLLGMNAADLFELPCMENEVPKRIDYNRAKTRSKRRDKAFISVKVIKESLPLLKKYAGKLQIRYKNTEGLNQAINEGLKFVSKTIDIPNIDFYDMRHSFATLARRKCGFSKDDVAEALNQTDRTVTDTYIAQDWSLIDKVQEAVVKLLKYREI